MHLNICLDTSVANYSLHGTLHTLVNSRLYSLVPAAAVYVALPEDKMFIEIHSWSGFVEPIPGIRLHGRDRGRPHL